jgi:hypothetical protein
MEQSQTFPVPFTVEESMSLNGQAALSLAFAHTVLMQTTSLGLWLDILDLAAFGSTDTSGPESL